jgi:hypothetical protein
VRLYRADTFQVTALVEGGRMWPSSVVPARLPRSPLQEGDLTTIRPALAIAGALSPRLGLQASVSYAWQELDVIQENTYTTLTGSAALTFDVRPFTLLVAGQYAHEFDEADTTDVVDTIFGAGESSFWGEAGIVYRGVHALDLGAHLDVKLDDIGDESRWLGQVRLAYYFD